MKSKDKKSKKVESKNEKKIGKRSYNQMLAVYKESNNYDYPKIRPKIKLNNQ